MNGLINFIKSLFGFENPKECMIGLAHFDHDDLSMEYERPVKKVAKQELTLSQMLKRQA